MKTIANRWKLHTHWAAVTLCCSILMPLPKNDPWKQTRNLFWFSLELNSIHLSNCYHRISSSIKGQEATGASSSCLGAKQLQFGRDATLFQVPLETNNRLGAIFSCQQSNVHVVGLWREAKDPRETKSCRDKGRTCKVHTGASARGIDTATFWLEGDSVHAMWPWNSLAEQSVSSAFV